MEYIDGSLSYRQMTLVFRMIIPTSFSDSYIFGFFESTGLSYRADLHDTFEEQVQFLD